MTNKLKKIIFLSLTITGLTLISGHLSEVKAQCGGDPFCKPASQQPKNPNAPGKTPVGGAPVKIGADGKPIPKTFVPVPVGAPSIQDRINYYKMIRERAALEGKPLPKVTSVLVLDEMSVMGIFRTPRGYAAMVQANPINLSYTIYPGEKFFDGQLVAVEENKLVFRKVVKMSNGKFLTSEESKTLRQYTQQEEIQGTAPVDASAKTETKPAETAPASDAGQPVDPTKPVKPSVVISPLEEMNKQPVETPKSAKDKSNDKNKKGKSSASKKPAKVAANKKQ